MATAATIKIPFSVGSSPWLQQIADLFLKAAQGDANAFKSIQAEATASDAVWSQEHRSPNGDPHAYDYARNAFKAAYAALPHAPATPTTGTAAAKAPAQPAPSSASTTKTLLYVAGGLVVLWLAWKLLG